MAPKRKIGRKRARTEPKGSSQSKPSRKGIQILQYSDKQMAQAILDVKNGVSIRKAAINNNVPRITLNDKVHEKSPTERRMGPATVIPAADEKMIVDWLLYCKSMNFPVTPVLLLDRVQRYLQKKNINTCFKDNRPGRTWIKRFQARYPHISLRTPQNLTQSRANVSEADIRAWANRNYAYFNEKDLHTVLEAPERVFNCDETAVFLNPKENRVFARKGDKTVYQQVNSDEKECLTVLVTANAAGMLAPPLTVFRYERIPDHIASSVPPGWGLGKSPDSGWMTAALFYEFIVNVFEPWLTKSQIQRPVILFMDGHSSHVSLHTSLFCSENGITLVTLYPNSTHLTQPMDVAVFKSLKIRWRDAVQEWRLNNLEDPVLRKKDFCPLLKKVLSDIPSSAIVNGFRTCGLVPWNPDVVIDRMKVQKLGKTKDNNNGKETQYNIHAHWTALKVLETTIGHEKVKMFGETDAWNGSVEDNALFKAWKAIRSIVFPTGSHTNINESLQDMVQNESSCPDNLDSSDEVVVEFPKESASSAYPTASVIASPMATASPTAKTAIASPTEQNPIESVPGPSTSRDFQACPGNSSAVQLPFDVPSPFNKVARFFPEKILQAQSEKQQKKKLMFPDAVTSEHWQEFYKEKAIKKQEEAEAKKKRAEERLRKRQEKELLLQQKKDGKCNRKKNSKAKAPKQLTQGKNKTKQISKKTRKKKKSSPVPLSEEDEDWSSSKSSEHLNPDSEDSSCEVTFQLAARRQLPFTNSDGNSQFSKLLSSADGVCPLNMNSPREINNEMNGEELVGACNSLLDTVNSFDQPVESADNPFGIEENDVVLALRENKNKIFIVTSLIEDSFIGVPLICVDKSTNTFKLSNQGAQLIFLSDVTNKLNPKLQGNDEERRYVLSGQFN